MTEPQEIGTAPLDGSRFLAHAVGAAGPFWQVIHLGCCNPDHKFSSSHQCVAHPSNDCNLMFVDENGYRWGVKYTHWLPLPSIIEEFRGTRHLGY